MNPSDWRKAAALVSQHKQAATITETDQLNSMPLSEISIDDSGLLVVHYGSHVPIASSRLFQVSLRVHYTLLYHLLVQDQ